MNEGGQETKQVANVVAGDQAGGHIYKSTTVYNSGATPMSRMITKYRQETEQDRQIKQTIEDLQRWQQREGDVIGLAEKLRRGGRVEITDIAILAKDRFARALVRHEFSPAAQEIYAFLLAKVYQLFSQIVYPQICRNADVKEIDRLLANDVYARVEAMLEENPLGLSPEDVMGMLYWLTGNCHLKWNVHADLQSSI